MGSNDLRRLTTADVPRGLRESMWSEVLNELGLSSDAASCRGQPPVGHAALNHSVRGAQFATLTASPQTLAPLDHGAGHAAAGTLLVLAVLRGKGCLSGSGRMSRLNAGDILLMDPTREWRAELQSEFTTVAIRMHSAGFVRRLLGTGADDANRIDGRSGLGAVCLELMRSVSEELHALDQHELGDVESTLSGLLVSCLSVDREEDETPAEDSTAVQLTHLRRVCRAIETRLVDPDLQIDEVAGLEGLSVRYVQKLLKAGGTTFTEYVKSRRLESCSLDLANPALSQFSISELCFRWGFSDAANFSRAFSARYGMSPKVYRSAPPREQREHRLRGRPPEAVSATEQPRGEPAGDADRRRRFRDVMSDHARYVQGLALSPKRAASGGGVTAAPPDAEQRPNHYYVPASEHTVHWGYLSRALKPVLTVHSGDVVTVETLTQHASDDWERMVAGDAGAESVFNWTPEHKAVDRRGAGPMDASIFGRGAGEGFGVHICTGPVYIQEAEPGDVLEIRILDITPRPSHHPDHCGRVYGSNAATWWGFQYEDLITEPRKREVITLYEIDQSQSPPQARALYNYRWTPQTDPFGVRHDTIDYPGVPVDPASVDKQYGVLAAAVIPVRPHFGVLGVAPAEQEIVDLIPPSHFGGNLDNWRAGKGARLYLPVGVDGALFSVGDPHASQGDGEVCGTAIECSLTGVFQLVLHKRRDLAGHFLEDLSSPFLETAEEWVLQGLSFPNYLAELGPNAQTRVYNDATLESAMRDAVRKARHYLMKAHGLSEDEAISLISVAVDFGVTQVVDGNLGIHALIRKSVFPHYRGG